MSYSSNRRDARDPARPLNHRVSHARSCAMLIAQKFNVHRDAVLERVRKRCGVDLNRVASEDELNRAIDLLEEIRFRGVVEEPETRED